jgi:hypothetical protein
MRACTASSFFGHVEQSERDDLILIADVARLVGPLKAVWHGVTRIPLATELLRRTGFRRRAENMTIIT